MALQPKPDHGTVAVTREDEIGAWWAEQETQFISGGPPRPTGSGWRDGLARALAAELRFDLSQARGELAACATDVPVGQWSDVWRLLSCRVEVRAAQPDGLDHAVRAAETLVGPATRIHPATSARTFHLLAVAFLRLGRPHDAEVALYHALSDLHAEPARTWALDTWGQALVATGAWQEARGTFAAVMDSKIALGDGLGVAITAGHLARMELMLGYPDSAREAARRGLTVAAAIPPLSRLRLATMDLEASLNEANTRASEQAARVVHDLLGEVSGESHYLQGFANLALARQAEQPDIANGLLAEARRHLALPDHLAMWHLCSARAMPETGDDPAWLSGMQRLFEAAGGVTEAEVLSYLFLAERASSRGDSRECAARLDSAYGAVALTNSPLLLEVCDHVAQAVAPGGMPGRIAERFSGRSLDELVRTALEDASLIFVDLVGFTARSNEMDPEQVMATARGLFELAVPLLVRHGVRPLSYLGDGLLAVAQGPGHACRSVAFATGLVGRGERLSRMRRFRNERWGLSMRGGVASGPVVLGTLGSAFKLEFTAIGATTNLAARLQAAAEPGQVMCAERTASEAGMQVAKVEGLSLKGFPDLVRAVRLSVDPAKA